MTGVLAEYSAEHLRRVHERFAAIGVAQLSDAANQHVRPVALPFTARTPAIRVCGPVFPVATDNDMLPCLQALASVPPGWVLLIVNSAETSEALVGDIFTLAAQTQGVGGIVVHGAVRDLADLTDMEIPVFSTSVTFVSARTTDQIADQVPYEVRLAGVPVAPGDWLFGDPDGFLVVPAIQVGAVMMAGRVLRNREEKLKAALREGHNLAKLTGLEEFLAGTAPLGYSP
jgi:4-hydroxy-4-methyl-2-oxoglutarate aldolase